MPRNSAADVVHELCERFAETGIEAVDEVARIQVCSNPQRDCRAEFRMSMCVTSGNPRIPSHSLAVSACQHAACKAPRPASRTPATTARKTPWIVCEHAQALMWREARPRCAWRLLETCTKHWAAGLKEAPVCCSGSSSACNIYLVGAFWWTTASATFFAQVLSHRCWLFSFEAASP